MKDNHDQDAAIGASLETFLRHISETPRNELAALRAALDQQISSIEARLEASNHKSGIDATIQIIARITGERIAHARQQAESTVGQALAANAMLRTALDTAQQQLQSAQTAVAAAEADRSAIAAQQREILNEKNKLAAVLDKSHAQLFAVQAQLKISQQQAKELAVERLELQQRLKDVTAARVAAEAHYQQLVIASQKLTDGLSQTLQREHEQVRAVASSVPVCGESVDEKAADKIIRLSPPLSKKALSTNSTAPSVVNGLRKPLQFSEQARDAIRVKIRRGTHISVDGIPGVLVDLSIGGAQAVLRQSVTPNQLVRLICPTTAGQLICKARIVWTLYEQPETSLSVYRIGMKFTDVDAAAVEDFMNDFREEPLMQARLSSEIA